MISDGAEILKRLPRAMPKPTTHIIDWFHIAMKIQPMQQIADHVIRSQSGLAETLPTIGRDIRAVKWRLWHGRGDRAIHDLEQLLASLHVSQGEGELSMVRLHSLGSQLLTYIRSNRSCDRQLWKALPSRTSRGHDPCRVGSQFRDRQTHGQEAADALVSTWCSHANAGSDSRDE
ncbi:hypothetical protein [Mesorhizobium sp. M1078]|uniref:hypothetical protein n=1 Tax=Mesorhizobium sp. M1078 TaxID=2957055 RepID=UPI0033386850